MSTHGYSLVHSSHAIHGIGPRGERGFGLFFGSNDVPCSQQRKSGRLVGALQLRNPKRL